MDRFAARALLAMTFLKIPHVTASLSYGEAVHHCGQAVRGTWIASRPERRSR